MHPLPYHCKEPGAGVGAEVKSEVKLGKWSFFKRCLGVKWSQYFRKKYFSTRWKEETGKSDPEKLFSKRIWEMKLGFWSYEFQGFWYSFALKTSKFSSLAPLALPTMDFVWYERKLRRFSYMIACVRRKLTVRFLLLFQLKYVSCIKSLTKLRFLYCSGSTNAS